MRRSVERVIGVLLCGLLGACGGSGGASQGPLTEATTPATTGSPGNDGGTGAQAADNPSVAATEAPGAETPASDPDAESSVATIRVLALHSTALDNRFADVDLRIRHLFNVANQVLTTSGVASQLVIAGTAAVDYFGATSTPGTLDDLTDRTDSAFADVATLRDNLKADLVTLFIPYLNDGYCGYAWIGGFQTGADLSNPLEADFGYSVVAADCSDYSLIHELGHNLGLAHSRDEAPDGGTTPWAAGHGVEQQFVTVMASETAFNALRLPLFSSPDLDCGGAPCGVPAFDPEAGADAVSALNMTAPQVARYRD